MMFPRGPLQQMLLAQVALFSVVTFCLYAIDKSASRGRGRRTPEATLHLFALCGGWPGALLARRLLRHKTAKAGFTLRFWLTVGAHLTVLLWLWPRLSP